MSSSSSSASVATNSGVTFAASSKQKVVEKIRSSKTPATLREQFKNLKPYAKSVGGEIIQSSPNVPLHNHMNNGFVGAVHRAYSQHHRLMIRPDDVWTCLATQFSRYVDANGEVLRSGQKELKVHFSGSLNTVDYGEFARKIIDKMSEHLKDPDVRAWLIPSFSTTTVNDVVINSVVLMSAMQKYFKYVCFIECGLPQVTLLGTLEDWQTLRAKIDRFVKYDIDNQMKDWVSLLGPILDEFVNSYQGKVNLEFWDKVCSHLGGGSGPSYISGWLTAFCVFDNDGKYTDERNHKYSKYKRYPYPVVETENVPSGVVFVPVLVNDNGTEYKTQMMAGQMCYSVTNGDTIQPSSDWAIGLVVGPTGLSAPNKGRAGDD